MALSVQVAAAAANANAIWWHEGRTLPPPISHLCCIPLSAFASFASLVLSPSLSHSFLLQLRAQLRNKIQNCICCPVPCRIHYAAFAVRLGVCVCLCIFLCVCVCVHLCVSHVKMLRLLPFHSVSFALCGQHVLLKCVSCIAIPCILPERRYNSF